MHVAIFGSIDEGGFPPGWTREAVVAVFGSVELDLTRRPPADGAVLSATSVFGSVEVTVPPGSRVSARGVSFLGSRKIRVEPGDGPALSLKAVAVFGSVEVREPAAEP